MGWKEVCLLISLFGFVVSVSISKKESDTATAVQEDAKTNTMPHLASAKIWLPLSRTKRDLFKKKGPRIIIVNRYYGPRRNYDYYNNGDHHYFYSRPDPDRHHYQHDSGESYQQYLRPHDSGHYRTGHYGGNRHTDSGEYNPQRVDYGEGGFAHYGGTQFNTEHENPPTLPRPLSPIRHPSTNGGERVESVEMFDHII